MFTQPASPGLLLKALRQNTNAISNDTRAAGSTSRLDSYPSPAPSRSVLVVTTSDGRGISTVVQSGARLAAALDGGLVLHVLSLGKPSGTKVQNNEPFIAALQRAADIVPADRMRLTEIVRKSPHDYIRDVVAVLQPSCIVMANELRATDDFHGPFAAKAILDSCTAPLWLVSTDVGPLQPLVVAAIDDIGARRESNTLNRTILQNAARLAAWLNASLHVFHAAFQFDVPTRILGELQQLQRVAIDQWLQDEHVTVQEVHVPVGLADVELANYAEIYRPCMVVVGTARSSMWKQYFHYNVTMATAKSLSTDLLVVRQGASVLPDIEVPGSAGYGARAAPDTNSRIALQQLTDVRRYRWTVSALLRTPRQT
jgi:nucleotide-binding universal stress UspA family protein